MAIYHLSVKVVARSHGRSIVAAAAYRSGSRLTDDRPVGWWITRGGPEWSKQPYWRPLALLNGSITVSGYGMG